MIPAEAWAAHDELERVWLDTCSALRAETDPAKKDALDRQADFAAARLNGAQTVLRAMEEA